VGGLFVGANKPGGGVGGLFDLKDIELLATSSMGEGTSPFRPISGSKLSSLDDLAEPLLDEGK
jgi:hypothetical protein